MEASAEFEKPASLPPGNNTVPIGRVKVILGIIVEEKGACGDTALEAGRLRVRFPMAPLELFTLT